MPIPRIIIEEIPILNALSKAILEYIYSAPYLATLAEKQLEKVKSKKQIDYNRINY